MYNIRINLPKKVSVFIIPFFQETQCGQCGSPKNGEEIYAEKEFLYCWRAEYERQHLVQFKI